MSRTLEDIHIKSRGIKAWIFVIIAIFVLTVTGYPTRLLWAQHYYVNTYENPYGPSQEQLTADIFVKSIDLGTHAVTDSVQLSARGEILFKKPADAFINNQHYLVTVNVPGQFGSKVFYAILRAVAGDLTVVRDDSIENARVEFFRQYAGESGFRFGLTTYRERNTIFQTGLYGLDHRHNFRYLRDVDTGNEPGTIRGIEPYEYLIKVPLDTASYLYYTWHGSDRWLVKMDNDHIAAIDSLSLLSVSVGNAIFAYHPT